jgi:hypothetical protein
MTHAPCGHGCTAGSKSLMIPVPALSNIDDCDLSACDGILASVLTRGLMRRLDMRRCITGYTARNAYAGCVFVVHPCCSSVTPSQDPVFLRCFLHLVHRAWADYGAFELQRGGISLYSKYLISTNAPLLFFALETGLVIVRFAAGGGHAPHS